jgi:hypothetical protein
MASCAVFVDTTIQVERSVGTENPARAAATAELLSAYGFLVSCGFSRLEFKRVVIQNLALLLDYINENGEMSFFRAMQRATALRQDRRTKTLVNILAWVGYQIKGHIEVTIGDDADQALATRADSYIRNSIRSLWIWFDKKLGHVADKMECQRGREGPQLRDNGTFDVRVRETLCKNKGCNNSNFFREQLPRLRQLADSLRRIVAEGGELTGELTAAVDAIEAAIHNPDRLYDYKNCLQLGDVWIHFESLAAKVTDFASTNIKESDVLCPLLGLNMKVPRTS